MNYFKNVSEKATVVLTTSKGRITVKAGEVIKSEYAITVPTPKSIVVATEEEYNTFLQEKENSSKSISESSNEVSQLFNEDNKELVQPGEPQLAEDGVIDFVKNLFNKGIANEPIQEEPAQTEEIEKVQELIEEIPELKEDATQVNEMGKEEQIAELQTCIDDLKQTWLKTKSPRKKEQLQKEIKEIQKQIDKLS